MASILVVYGSGEGQTAKVARFVRDTLEARGHDVAVRNVTDGPDVPFEEFDAVLVGSPVHNRRHLPTVVDFVERNREAIERRPNGLFQLSLVATVPYRWARGGDEAFVETLVETTGWRPDHVGSFAGAVRYSQYTPVERTVFRLVAAATTGDTDTSRDYEYTDWNDVEAFAATFAEGVERRVAATGVERSARTRTRGLATAGAGVAALLALAGVAYWAVVRRYAPPEC